ncbi:hypothetical protein V5O48_004729 [Marasmius crinis-equi]|uniref:AAA-ATPase-like domain-containing protein n=1 Tax=Marasmius crinis-equi TaxID=585013 RepID=A0ABR3FPY9_9AGAR
MDLDWTSTRRSLALLTSPTTTGAPMLASQSLPPSSQTSFSDDDCTWPWDDRSGSSVRTGSPFSRLAPSMRADCSLSPSVQGSHSKSYSSSPPVSSTSSSPSTGSDSGPDAPASPDPNQFAYTEEPTPPVDEEKYGKPHNVACLELELLSDSEIADEGDELLHFQAYTRDSIRARIEQLRSNTTDFGEIAGFRHYCDRTMIFHVTSCKQCVLLRIPPGHGKSTTLSMVEYFYDILRKNDFHRLFKHFGIGYRIILREDDWEHSDCFVLKLDFGELAVREPGFSFNTALNTMLRAFVRRYESLIPKLTTVQFEKDSAAKTLDWIVSHLEGGSRVVVCIDNYDTPYWNLQGLGIPRQKYEELHGQLADFLSTLAKWNATYVLPLVMLAGEHDVVKLLSDQLGRRAYDIVGALNFWRINAHRKDMLGLTEHETKIIGYRLDDDFHSLGLARIGRNYLDSEEGREYWEEVGKDYGLCFGEILDLYANELERKVKSVGDQVPAKTMSLTELRRSNQ